MRSDACPIQHAVDQLLTQNPDITHWVVAYSGGMDSHVLLHALSQALASIPHQTCEAIHINHGQSVHAKQWEGHTARVCSDLSITYQCVAVNPDIARGCSVESVLRDARYAVFKAAVNSPQTAIVLAHHADDQAETVLLRALRGAGVTGLGAMKMHQPFASGHLIRPLLGCSLADIKGYAQTHDLTWVEDESNADSRFDRNFLRNEVMPLLRSRWPALAQTLSRSASNCQEAQQLLDEQARSVGAGTETQLSWQPLSVLSRPAQANAVRYWLRKVAEYTPSEAQLSVFLSQLASAKSSKIPTLSYEFGCVRCYRNQLYFSKKTKPGLRDFALEWDLSEPLDLPVGGRLVLRQAQGRGIDLQRLSQPVVVQTRQGGEKIKLPGSHCHQTLKNCWQRFGVPPWQREQYPLVYHKGALLAIPSVTCSGDYAVAYDEQGWEFVWEALETA